MSNKILIIAGLDPSGNAGIIRDLEIVSGFNLKPSCVITALTAQNKKKFFSAQVVSKTHFKKQLKSVSPLSQYKAIKIGMLGNEEIVQSLVSFLKKERKVPPIVLDPVYQSTTGGALLTQKGKDLLWKRLIPLVTLWTPNLDEASYFSGLVIRSDKDIERVGDILWKEKKTPVFIKGRHSKTKVKDFYFDGKQKRWFVYSRVYTGGPPLSATKALADRQRWRPPAGRRAGTVPLRGTGCALSSLIASEIALGNNLDGALRIARQRMHQWIKRRLAE